MTNHEKFKEDKELVTRAESLRFFNATFLEEVNEYTRLLLESGELKKYIYTMQDKTIYEFPVLGFIGEMGLNNTWNDPFNTCCRYSLLEEGLKEVKTGNVVLEELVERVSQAEKIIPTMPKHKQDYANKVYEKLKFYLNLLVAGLGLISDMKKHMDNNGGFMDIRHNEVSWLWREAVQREYELVPV